MSERVKRLVPHVIPLKNLKPNQRKILLQYPTKDQIRALEDIALNIVRNTTPLPGEQVEIRKRHRRPLKLLALKRFPIKAKREILQSGGFVRPILPVIASILGTVLG